MFPCLPSLVQISVVDGRSIPVLDDSKLCYSEATVRPAEFVDRVADPTRSGHITGEGTPLYRRTSIKAVRQITIIPAIFAGLNLSGEPCHACT